MQNNQTKIDEHWACLTRDAIPSTWDSEENDDQTLDLRVHNVPDKPFSVMMVCLNGIYKLMVPFDNQTWLARKSPLNWHLNEDI
jgi:hypothetical protein